MKNKVYNNSNYKEDILLLLDSYYLELNYNKQKLKILNRHKPFILKFNKLKEHKREVLKVENNIKLYEEKIAKIVNDEMS